MNTATHEREVLIKAFSDITKEFEGREWIMEGRGSYTYTDDEYRKEVTYLFEAFKKIKTEMWSNIKSKTYEYKNEVEKPLLKQIEEMKELFINTNFLIKSITKDLDDSDLEDYKGICVKISNKIESIL